VSGKFTRAAVARLIRPSAACKRGITDLSEVLVEPWAAGNFGFADEEGKRVAYGHCFVRNAQGDNPYARPIAHLHPIIDLQHMKVLRVDDFGVVPLPPECTPITHPNLRTDLKLLEISQAEGPSFSVEAISCVGGNEPRRPMSRADLPCHRLRDKAAAPIMPRLHGGNGGAYGDHGSKLPRNTFDTAIWRQPVLDH
jgi:hypothetical protein